MMYLHGDKETTDFIPLDMEIPSIEEEVEVEEGENCFKKDKWINQMKDSEEDFPGVME